MIAEEKIKIYQKYGGDIDGFSRGGENNEKKLFEDNDWSLINNVFQDLEIVKKGLCSSEFKSRFEKLLNDNFESGAIEMPTKII